LQSDVDFIYSYSGNVNAGNAKVTVASKSGGNYTGSISKSYVIAKADYDMSGVQFVDESREYNGTTQQLSVSGALPTGADGIQVTVTYSGSATNVADGKVTITATFATESVNYNTPAIKTATLTITGKDLADASIANIDSYIYDGGAKTPTPAVTIALNGGSVTLQSGVDFTYSYSGNVNAGNAKVTVASKSGGNYTGSISKSFVIAKADLKEIAFGKVELLSSGYIKLNFNTPENCTYAISVKDNSGAIISQSNVSTNYYEFIASGSSSYDVYIVATPINENNYNSRNATNRIEEQKLKLEVTLKDTIGNGTKSFFVYFGGTYADLPVPTADGYEFVRWETESGEIIESGNKVLITGAITLTAIWNSKQQESAVA
jgi:uncharacterized repeat protein (TIGR02543 family)